MTRFEKRKFAPVCGAVPAALERRAAMRRGVHAAVRDD
jgi:hypothetical protein